MKPYDWEMEDRLNVIGLDLWPADESLPELTAEEMSYVRRYFEGDERITRAGAAIRQFEGTPEAQTADFSMFNDTVVDPRTWAFGMPYQWPNGAPLVIVKDDGTVIKDGVIQ